MAVKQLGNPQHAPLGVRPLRDAQNIARRHAARLQHAQHDACAASARRLRPHALLRERASEALVNAAAGGEEEEEEEEWGGGETCRGDGGW